MSTVALLTCLYFRSNDLEELINVTSQELISTTIGGEKVSLIACKPKEPAMPEPVYIKLSTLVTYLALAFEKEPQETYDFYLDNIILEYKEMSMRSYFYRYSWINYRYYDDHISLGLPTQRYNWFLKQVEQVIAHKVSRNSLNQNNAHTWVIADSSSLVECFTYSKSSDQLEPAGSLDKVMCRLKSNVVGVGHFRISVVQSEVDQKYFLKFRLTKFQLKDTTNVSSTISLEVINKTEPPAELMAKLNITN